MDVKKSLLQHHIDRRGFLAASAIGLSAAALAACSSPSTGTSASSSGAAPSGTITYSFWGDGPTRDLHTALGNAFTKANPSIQVEPVYVANTSDYLQKIQTGIAGGNPPDVINFLFSDLQNFAELGAVIPVTDRVKSEWDDLNLDDVLPNLMDAMQVNKEYYALPRNASGWYLYYNKDMFDAADVAYPDESWTWETMATQGKKLVGDGASGQTWALGADVSGSAQYISFLWQGGADMFSKDGSKIGFDNKEGRAAFEYLHDLMYKDEVAAPGAVLASTASMDLFKSQRVAMVTDSGAQIASLQGMDFKWDVALLPEGPGENRDGRIGPTGLAIPTVSKNQDAAWEFVKYVNGPEGQELLCSTGFSAPVRQSILDDTTKYLPTDKFAVNRQVAVDGYLKHGRLSPSHSKFTQIDSAIHASMQLYFVNQASLDDTIKQIHTDVDPLLAS